MEPERNAAAERRRKPAADAANPLPLVTSAGFAERNGHGRAGKRADRKLVQRNKERVGHGGFE
jgi:hypothetical protein